ncbi:hypothetical protein M7I_6539 [Glarea lozoyensis 74030]|uniref:Uncharacterized protein n=1 Tax=Glarea lozoyensis (strain ATCC 74030 / MF5533) TaxID=1104152 RepID=H0EUV0_GLAL7|nr:hypothetical protein M7I_6539 [Glarea lozoyensis 74030]
MGDENLPPNSMTPTKSTKSAESSIWSYNNIGSPTVRPSNIIPISGEGLGLRTRSAVTAVAEPSNAKENQTKASKRSAEDTFPKDTVTGHPKRGKFEAMKGPANMENVETEFTTSCEIENRLEDGQPAEPPQHNADLVVGTSITDPGKVRVFAFLTNSNQLKFAPDETDVEKSDVKFHKTRSKYEEVIFDPKFCKGKESDTKEYIRSVLLSRKGSSGTLNITRSKIRSLNISQPEPAPVEQSTAPQDKQIELPSEPAVDFEAPPSSTLEPYLSQVQNVYDDVVLERDRYKSEISKLSNKYSTLMAEKDKLLSERKAMKKTLLAGEASNREQATKLASKDATIKSLQDN